MITFRGCSSFIEMSCLGLDMLAGSLQDYGAAHASSDTGDMNMRELDRLKVIQAVRDRVLKPGQAADRLALSVRQVERLVQRYRARALPDWCQANAGDRAAPPPRNSAELSIQVRATRPVAIVPALSSHPAVQSVLSLRAS